jgi:Tfp pilus assembly protein PilN
MSSGKKENKKFLNFLNALASVIPPEMVLDYIQFNDGSITIQGYVDAQYVFSRFCTDINDELQNINLSVISSSLKHNTLGGKTFEVICEGNND